MYADTVTRSMRAAIDETERRRELQMAYNKEHGIVPKTIVKSVRDLIEISASDPASKAERKAEDGVKLTRREKEEAIAKLEKEMAKASKMLEFEYAAILRDRIIKLRGE
jgi:excinuclease ABC subunit B